MAATATTADGAAEAMARSHDAPIITSLLDTDLYKLTMLQAVRRHFPTSPATFKFTNRSAATMSFSRHAYTQIQDQVSTLGALRLSEDEAQFLRRECPYFAQDFLHWLQNDFRLRPDEQVQLRFVPGDSSKKNDAQEEYGQIEVEVRGTWEEIILYEVPLMAIISEVYFRTVDTLWDMTAQFTLAAEKAYRLVSAGCVFSDFGTRRRRSFAAHHTVVRGLIAGCARARQDSSSSSSGGKMLGTSNVLLAKTFGLTPIGTMAHEWFMGVGAALGYPHAAENGSNTSLRALQLWDQVYAPPPHGPFTPTSPAHDLTVALTDTFSTSVFWDELLLGDAPAPSPSSTNAGIQAAKEAGTEIVHRWRALRQDSGDSKAYARQAVQRYRSAGVDPSTKVIIYSDGLDVEKCIDLAKFSKEIGIGAGFGIGTSLTNDFLKSSSSPSSTSSSIDISEAPVPPDRSLPASKQNKSKALNMVIKLSSINGEPTVKISDELSKNTGDKAEVAAVKRRFGLDGADGAAGGVGEGKE
ncbi:hypothetical protein A4X09_0g5589 [Tilletia walkeri]|uniref:nicotinate phosphoribosyltransferase n=1 Tax=Tilletia walkeri TaxID=117179 RepID=A0A8X7T3G5_9BASI|nr:hypothetical protein A4X09_0g5589 [Tilletia walkeri]